MGLDFETLVGNKEESPQTYNGPAVRSGESEMTMAGVGWFVVAAGVLAGLVALFWFETSIEGVENIGRLATQGHIVTTACTAVVAGLLLVLIDAVRRSE